MQARLTSVLLLAALGGCGWLTDSQKYSVYFQPYSADLDQQARDTIHAAADFARAHPLQRVTLNGFSSPPDPGRDIDGLSAHRADVVKQVLVADGVGEERITTVANGTTDPKTLPDIAVRRVDISVGQ
jgi:outer membrane protein OmpA-like peptidoglycan-associated protein